MPTSTDKKKPNSAAKKGAKKPAGGAAATAMPPPKAILLQTAFQSPGGGKYRVIETNEVDSYEQTGSKPGLMPLTFLAAATPPAGDSFSGTARRAAKISIAKAATEKFTDLKQLVASLVADKTMRALPIKANDPKSNRVAEEKRNVRVRAFLYAASREDDNDFHLIVGRSPKAKEPLYMTMEVSGLPPAGNASHATLKAVRAAYKTFFGAALPGLNYKYYKPPVPIEIAGSLFFDMSHARGKKPGPATLKKDMPTIWEVHPVTDIVFEP